MNTAEFKDSPLGRIPVDWDVVKLEDVIEIHDNKRIPLSETERINRKGDYPYCGANGVIDYIDDYIFDGEFLLLAEDGGDYSSLGRSAYLMNGKFWVNNHAHVIEAIHSKTTNKFLLYILTYLNLNHYTVGSTRKKLNQSIMRKIKLPLPPLEEQKMISEILQDVDSAIENVNKAIDVTEELKRGLMQRLLMEGINHTEFKDSPLGRIPVDWDVVKLGDVVEIRKNKKPETFEEIAFISMEDIPLSSMFTSYKIRSKSEIKSFVYCEAGDLLLSKITPSFENGKQGFVPLDIPRVFALATTEVYPIVCTNIQDIFLFYILKFSKFRKKLEFFMRGSTGRQRVPKNALMELKVPLPPLEEQKMISEILQDVDRRLELLRERKVKLENIKRGLMNDLLTGKRRVRITS